MPKHAKRENDKPLPQDLPMPKYEYQVPTNEGFSFKLFSVEHDSKSVEDDGFCLQNATLAI
jgi:hypothetical protein